MAEKLISAWYEIQQAKVEIKTFSNKSGIKFAILKRKEIKEIYK